MAGHSSTSHWRVAASNIILLVSWAIFVVVFLSASELIAVGILTMLGVGALYTVLRPSGLGSGKSKALMFQSIEFAMVAIFFGFFQLTLDATGLTISTTFGVAPGGSSLVGAGMLTLFLGLVFAFWALGLAWYPSRGYGESMTHRDSVEGGAQRVWGMTKGSNRVHIVKSGGIDNAYSWCGYYLPFWFAAPTKIMTGPPFRYCRRCIALLNEAHEPDSVWHKFAKQIHP